MKSQIIRILAAALIAMALTAPASAAQVWLNGVLLGQKEGWIKDGRSYMSLNTLCGDGSGYRMEWDGTLVRLNGNGVDLSVRLGSRCVEVNGRALYLPGDLTVTDSGPALPLRILEAALGGAVSWEEDTAAARLELRDARAPQADYSEEDLYWLSHIIDAESRGEPLEGQIAVGNVVLNRVRSELYPDTIREVVLDRREGIQFEPVGNGTVYRQPEPESILCAKLALEGANTVGECMYFFAPALSRGTWIVNNCNYYSTIGSHRFYSRQ